MATKKQKPNGKFIIYVRVSTREQKQGHSLDAQKHVCREFVRQQGGKVVRVFEEVASGDDDHRPEVEAAKRLARRSGATLLTAKLDRLSRSVAFVADIMRNGPRWQVVEHPDASVLELHMRATFAQEEREKNSERTKAGLAQAKRRGVKLGSHRPGHMKGREAEQMAALAKGRAKVIANRQAINADLYAESEPIIDRTADESLRTVAAELEAAGILTARGSETWTPTAVKRLREQLWKKKK